MFRLAKLLKYHDEGTKIGWYIVYTGIYYIHVSSQSCFTPQQTQNYQDPSEVVDVLIAEDLAKIKIIKVTVGDIKISVVSLKDLVRMKENSGRAQDLLDLENLKKLSKEK